MSEKEYSLQDLITYCDTTGVIRFPDYIALEQMYKDNPWDIRKFLNNKLGEHAK